ncbi:mechanosensitive ion channel family protein [Oceanibacterium hippocampi]|uniref:Small-conductance mechanosensitive channel n=1 Tax=Oceanibacterium hippocampi TaxID=745714 RepID=A0A1Y5TWK1_9PROT|nr:mechanosensitive ion channel domain-containing protein [Oceanibacterium hippocampi]SLN75444.1 Small-conductance mechanosensitive channel [Oceanibacterium hippocampi]
MSEDTPIAGIFKAPDLAMAIEILAVIAIAGLLIAAVQRALPWVGNRLQGKRRLFVLALVPVLRLLLIIGAFIIIVPLLIKPSLQNMVALFGTIGLAIGFALKDLASSLIAGIVAVGEMPYRNGDWIRIDGIYGEVRHVGMRAVQIVTPSDDVVSIPHARLWDTAIVNSNDGSPRLQCIADFYLHPMHDAAKVREALTDVALTSPYLYFDEPIAVIIHEKPWGTWYQLKAYPVDARQQFRFMTDLTVRGKAAIGRLGAAFATVPMAEIDRPR